MKQNIITTLNGTNEKRIKTIIQLSLQDFSLLIVVRFFLCHSKPSKVYPYVTVRKLHGKSKNSQRGLVKDILTKFFT